MSLSPCTHCGKDFANEAYYCPHCSGARPRDSWSGVIAVAIFVLFVLGCGFFLLG